LKKILGWTIKIAAGLLVLLFLLFIGLTMYVNSHKKELIAQATETIHTKLSGNVTIEDLNVSLFRHFPSLSIRLINVSVTDSLYSKHQHKLLSAENLFVRLSTPSLITGRVLVNKFTLRNGGFYLFTDSTGYSNGYLLKPKNSNPPKPSNTNEAAKKLLEKVLVENFSFHLEDVPGDKLYNITVEKLEASVKKSGEIFSIDVDKKLQIGGIAFKNKNGSFVGKQSMAGKYTLQFDAAQKKLSFNDMNLKIGEQPFVFTGVFLLGKENSFQLHITSQQILVDFARSLLTPKISKSIGIVSVKQPLDVDATIGGSLAGGDPRVQVKFTTQNNQVDSKFINMTQCSFTGEYLNEVVPGNGYTDENSHIYVKDMSGIWEGMKLNIKDLNVMNLSHPSIAVQASSKFPLNELNSALQSETMKFTDGQGEFSLSYSGRTDSISSKNSTLIGYLRFKNGTLFLNGPQTSIQKCNGVFSFNNANLLVDSLKGELAGNAVYMKGRANNVLSVLSDDHVPVSLDWNIYAPEINLNSIRSVLMRKVSTKQTKNKRKTGISKTVENIDHLLSSGAVTASLRADRLRIEKMDARNFTASIQLEGNTWAVKSASLQHGDGSVAVSAYIKELSPNRLIFTSEIALKNVDAKKTFYAFENFGMKGISHEHIRGRLNLTAKYSIMLNGKGEPNMNSITGNANFSLKNGALLNFPPLLEVQKTAFKNRDFSNVQFAEISNKLVFENAGVTIKRMAINSSVLTLFLEGIYGLNNNTDISIQVPLKNLKKKENEAHPEFISGDAKGGMSVFLRAATDKDGKMKIKYDPLKRLKGNKSK
jgi:hypothetical protein